MRKMNRRKKIIFYTILILGLVSFAYISGILIPDEAVDANFSVTKLPPSQEYPFGTDWLGRNLFYRTIKGLSISITVGMVASFFSVVVAVFVGMVAAIGNKKLDGLMNWLIDLVMGVPHFVLIILISFALGRGLRGLLAGIIATHWASLARVIRAEVLTLKNEQYIAVSRRLGKSKRFILKQHILPHIVPQIIIGLVLMFPHAILHEAAISFLGYGLSPDKPAIGIILSESMKYISSKMWWIAVFPGGVLVSIVLLIDKLGEHLRILLSPFSAEE